MVDHLENCLQYTDDRAVRPVHTTCPPPDGLAVARGGAFYVGESAQSVEVAKELIGTVNEMNDHFALTCANNRMVEPREAKLFTR